MTDELSEYSQAHIVPPHYTFDMAIEYQLGARNKAKLDESKDITTGESMDNLGHSTTPVNERLLKENQNYIKVRIRANETGDMPHNNQVLQYPLAINEPFIIQQE